MKLGCSQKAKLTSKEIQNIKKGLRLFGLGLVTALSVGLIAVPIATAQKKQERSYKEQDKTRKTSEQSSQERRREGIRTTTGMTLAKANEVIGKYVYNEQGENMGEVEDLVIERNSGQVTYAVVSMGGFLGMGKTLFAVPWKSLEPGKEKDTYILNVDKTKLRSAPHFTKGEWPNLSDSTYGERVHDYYGQTPPWKERTSPSTDPEGKERKRTQ